MNYFDDLHIVRCGYHKNPCANKPSLASISHKSHPEVSCPVNQAPCRVGKKASHSIGVIHGSVFRRELHRCREMPGAFFYWLRDDEYFSWCSPLNEFYENRWIIFNGPRGERLLDALDQLADGEHYYPLKAPGPMEQRFDDIAKFFRTLSPATEYRAMPLFEALIAALYDITRAEHATSRIFRIVKDAENMIRQASEINHDFVTFAKEHQISYDYFRDNFRRYIGVPPHDFLLHCRADIARQLLREENLSIKAIAGMCGFERPSDFTRFFRKRTGMSPTECRQAEFP